MQREFIQREFTVFERIIHRFAFRPAIRRRLVRIRFVRRIYGGWNRTHPFDVAEQVETSGYVPADQLTSDDRLKGLIIPYAGSSPSVTRKAISTLPDVRDYSFVDLGCGKGRALLVASEYAFMRIIGVELSAELSATARRNVQTVANHYPERSPMNVVEGNAIGFELPAGKVVVFIYHSFGLELMNQLIGELETALENRLDHVFVVYYNPVHSVALDSSPVFKRWFAATFKLVPEEVGYAPDNKDTVVIWQSNKGSVHAEHPGSDRKIVILQKDWQAGLS